MQEQAFLKLQWRILFSVRCLLKTIKVTMIHYDIKVTMIKVTMIFIVVIFIIKSGLQYSVESEDLNW